MSLRSFISSHEEGRPGLRLSGTIIEIIRSGNEENSQAAWEGIIHACREYLLRYSSDRIFNYIDDLVSGAIVENIEIIRLPIVPPAKVLTLLVRSLTTQRRRFVREQAIYVPYSAIYEPPVANEAEEYIASEYVAHVLSMTRKIMYLATQTLSKADRMLIEDHYGFLGCASQSSPGYIWPSLLPCRRTLARARLRFFNSVERIISREISTSESKEAREILKTVLRLIAPRKARGYSSLPELPSPRSQPPIGHHHSHDPEPHESHYPQTHSHDSHSHGSYSHASCSHAPHCRNVRAPRK